MEYASVETYVFFESFHNIPGWFQSSMIFMSEKNVIFQKEKTKFVCATYFWSFAYLDLSLDRDSSIC